MVSTTLMYTFGPISIPDRVYGALDLPRRLVARDLQATEMYSV
jgi:hypothetical protein